MYNIDISTYISYSIYIYDKKRPLLQSQPSINRNTAHPQLKTGGWVVGGLLNDWRIWWRGGGAPPPILCLKGAL